MAKDKRSNTNSDLSGVDMNDVKAVSDRARAKMQSNKKRDKNKKSM